MDKGFIEAFNRFKFLKLQDLVSLYRVCSFKSYKKGEILAKSGSYCEYIYFIRKGIIRTYLLTSAGEERTTRLAKENDFTSCANSFLYQKPSTEYLEVVEDCKVFAVSIKVLGELEKKNERILRLSYEGMKESIHEAISRVEFFTIFTPEERYKKLLEETPDLIQRVPQKHLASYLGVTTVSLSRIRSRFL